MLDENYDEFAEVYQGKCVNDVAKVGNLLVALMTVACYWRKTLKISWKNQKFVCDFVRSAIQVQLTPVDIIKMAAKWHNLC